jgi:hypothetical protein
VPFSTVQALSKYGRTLKAGYVVPPVITSRPLRHPSTRNAILAGFIRLEQRFPSSEVDGGSRTSGLSLLSLSPHTDGITPGSQQFRLLFLSTVDSAFPSNVEGRRVALLTEGLSRNRTLSATPVRRDFTRLHHSLYATVYGFG